MIAPGLAALFDRYLDLTPLRGRPRGLVRCPFHEDRRPSLSIDLTRGVFRCFGCGEQGGWTHFARLVGERGDAPRPRQTWESDLQRARRRVIEAERGRQVRMADWWPYLRAMARLRDLDRLVADVRATARDDAAGWDALADAATVATFVAAHDAAIERLLTTGRVA
jgi:hypothetical protein